MAERRKFAKKYCKYSAMKLDYIDYKNGELLKISMSERGKINAIKRARHMALVPYIVNTNNLADAAYARR